MLTVVLLITGTTVGAGMLGLLIIRMPTRSYGYQAQKKSRDLAKIGRVYDVVFVRAFNILRALSGIGMAPNSSEYLVLALWFNS
jgi:hypothetical protein